VADDNKKSKAQLIRELAELRRCVADFGAIPFDGRRAKENQKSRAFINRIQHQSSNAIFTFDLEGRIQRVNQKGEEITGYSLEELINSHLSAIFSLETLPQTSEQFIRVSIHGETVSGHETEISRKDGNTRAVIFHIAPVYEAGKITGVVGTTEDITERKLMDKVFHTMMKTTIGATGQAFFDNTARNLCDLLGVECAIIGEIENGDHVRTLAMQLDGESDEGYEYDLSGTPCSNVAEKGYCVFPDGVCELFPDDKDLVEMKAEGYVGVPLRDQQGEAVGVLCAISRQKLSLPPKTQELFEIIAVKAAAEIERKKAESALVESERRYRSFIENTPIVAWISDQDGKTSFISPNVKEIYGYTQDEILAAGDELWFGRIHPDDRNIVQQAFQGLFNEQLHYDIEYRIQRKDGEWIWLHDRARVVMEQDGKPQVYGIFSDVTEAKHQDEVLNQTVHSLGERIKELRCLYAISTLAGQSELTFDQCMQHVVETIPPAWQFPEVTCARVMLQGRHYTAGDFKETPWRLASAIDANGKRVGEIEIFYLDERPASDKGPFLREELSLINAIAQQVGDIWKRKQAENALRVTQSRHEEAQRIAHLGHWVLDLAKNELIWSDENYRIFGVEPGTANTYETFLEAVHPDDYEFVDHAYTDSVKNRTPYEIEHRLLMKDGSIKWVNERCETEYADDGSPLRSIGTTLDITERKKAGEALRTSEEQIRLLLDSTAEAIYGIDTDGVCTLANAACLKMLGYDNISELTGKNIHELIHHTRPDGSLYPEEECRIYKAFREGKGTHVDDEVLWRKDGSSFPVSYWSYPVFKGDQITGSVVTFLDISEQIKARDALEESRDQLHASLEGTIAAVAKSVEARDPYTAGHQQRVAELAVAIALGMGLDEDRVEGIRMGASIQDIGKIHLPAEILSKPSKLSDLEYSLIQSHPQVGYDILKDISFPWPVADITHQHHERMDGSGYPQGLKGDEICLEARIVGVADVVEAISSHRPYRPALGIDVALDEIKTQRDKFYDPEVVDACLKLFAENRFSF
jgi:PAS domain S-box-containing protein